MIVNAESISLAFKGFKTVFTDAFLETPINYDKIAMTVPSASRDETYGWLGQFPSMREWVGPRHVKNIIANGFTIKNRKFESTLEISRDDIADDRLGIFKPMFSEMGQAARRHPEELIFGVLASGFTTNCYDGQFFFDVDHPVTDADGNSNLVSNFQGGAGTPWYLSPSFQFHPKTRQIVHLNGAGLVHNPDLYLTALASQDTAMHPANKPNENAPQTDLMKQLAEVLGLPITASPQDLIAKIAALLKPAPDPAKYMPVTAVQEMLADRHLERSTNTERRVLAKVNEASSKGYILGGSMREWALALCRSDEGTFDTFLETSGPRFAYLQKQLVPAGPPPASCLATGYAGAGSDLKAAVCAQPGLKPGTPAD